jgi:hypothetical protein
MKPIFDLHSLGWHSFQQLCLTIAREVLGQTVESFLDVNDGGRDGAFSGIWSPDPNHTFRGRFVIQCKFTSRVGHSLNASDLSDEIEKVENLVKRQLCDVYILMTNAGVSGQNDAKIKAKLLLAGLHEVVILNATWIDQQIRERKRLRMLVPRIYGLGDLTQILDARAYSQARAVLESMREDLAKVVITEAYRRAAQALDQHGYVLLIGEPAAGKTTIASMLAMAAADQWGATVLKLDNPSLVIDRWNPDEPSQFFWIDDAFGVTQYENSLVLGWNHVLTQIKTILRKGAKIVMTSRDYIYNRARQELKEGAFPLFNEAQVVIDVQALAADERRQILYNHLRLGDQPRDFRSKIKPYLETIATHNRFIPEIARRLADPFFTKNLSMDSWSLNRFVDQREALLIEVLRGLDRHSKAALALIYMRNDHLDSPIVLRSSEEQALLRLNSNLGSCCEALNALKGSLVLYSQASAESEWKFKHPTIGDAYAAILIDSSELLEIYLRGSAPEKLMEQVTCGSVGIEKAVILPQSLFPLIIERLETFSSSSQYKTKWLSSWDAKRSLYGFLARRCNRDFLAMYLEKNPNTAELISSPGLYLGVVSEVPLAIKLNELGLFPEVHRKQFVETVSKYAVNGEDASALNDNGIRSVFNKSELKALANAVHTKLLPRLSEVRLDLQSDYRSSNGSPDDHMYYFLECLAALESSYSSNKKIVKKIQHEQSLVGEWISDEVVDLDERPPRSLGEVDDAPLVSGTRSIFEDIDSL